MKLLFFDTESANQFNGKKKMCSFGYVLTDENFNILEQDDIFINPDVENFHWYILKYVLAHNEEFYRGYPTFPYYYERIKALFEASDYHIAHAIKEDIAAINYACLKYELEKFEFKKQDTQMLYKFYTHSKNKKSLKNIAIELNIEHQDERHSSLQDASICMQIIKKLCEVNNLSVEELFSNKNNHNNDGVIRIRSNRLQKKAIDVWNYHLENLKPRKVLNNKFKDKIVCISDSYESRNFREMLYLSQMIVNMGGQFTDNINKANLFVKYDHIKSDGTLAVSRREEYIKQEKLNIETISLERLLEIIPLDPKNIKSNFYRAINRYQKFIDEKSKETNEC